MVDVLFGYLNLKNSVTSALSCDLSTVIFFGTYTLFKFFIMDENGMTDLGYVGLEKSVSIPSGVRKIGNSCFKTTAF